MKKILFTVFLPFIFLSLLGCDALKELLTKDIIDTFEIQTVSFSTPEIRLAVGSTVSFNVKNVTNPNITFPLDPFYIKIVSNLPSENFTLSEELIDWSFSTPNIASFSGTDLSLSALAPGQTVLSVWLKSNPTVSMNISISVYQLPKPGSIQFIQYGHTLQLSWPKIDNPLYRFVLYRATPQIDSPKVKIYSGAQTTVLDKNLEFDSVNGTNFYYFLYIEDNLNNRSEPNTFTIPSLKKDASPPAMPSAFTAAYNDTNATVQLTWKNPTDIDFKEVKIVRSTVIPISVNQGTLIYTGDQTTAADTNQLESNTLYFYSAFAFDQDGNLSPSTKTSIQTPESQDTPDPTPDTTPPGPIHNLTATPGDTQIALSWTNPTDSDFKQVIIRRSIDFFPASPTEGDHIYTGTNTSFTDSGVTNGTTYFYSFFTEDTNGNINTSPVSVSATPFKPVPNPTHFLANEYEHKIELIWTNPTDPNFKEVVIRRYTTLGVEVSFPETPEDGDLIYQGPDQFTEEINLPYNYNYCYSIFAFDTANNHSSGAQLSVWYRDLYPPDLPTSVTINATAAQITLSWTNPTATDFEKIVIKKSTSPWPTIYFDGEIVYSGTNPFYTDTNVTIGTTYYYLLYSYDKSGNSSHFQGAFSGTPLDTTPPANPTNLSIISQDNQLTLNWTNPAENFDHIVIRRSTDDFPGFETGELVCSGNLSQFVDTNVLNDTLYYYVLFAIDAAGNRSSGVSISGTPKATIPHSGQEWQKPFYAPYVDASLYPVLKISDVARDTGQTLFVLAFIVAQDPSTPVATWGTYYSLEAGPDSWGPQGQYFLYDEIDTLRNTYNGDYMISFGGAINTPLAAAASSVDELANEYKRVIDTLQVTYIDFDIEGVWVSDTASIERRSQAIAQIQQHYAGLGKPLFVWYTLPVMPSGLTPAGVAVLQSAIDNGVNLDGVNVMTMDYGPSFPGTTEGEMAAYGIDAITALHGQLKTLYTSKTDAELWAMIGTTPMIGLNDVLNEIFFLQDAQDTVDFADGTTNNGNTIGMVSNWSLNRDHPSTYDYVDNFSTSKGVQTVDYEFLQIFKTVSD